MFGYIVTNKPEMKFREYDEYRTYYCGLCRELKEKSGIPGQLTLSFDLTFILLLLDALYEPPIQKGTTHCAVHPFGKQQIRRSEMTDYAADMNLLLTYYKCMDDWKDDRKITRRAYAGILEADLKKIKKKYPEKAEKIESFLEELSGMEKAGEKDLDKVSGCFGKILAETMAYREDMWAQSLRRIGFYLGKFIYILDAYDDLEEDLKNGNYNPLSECCKMEAFEGYVKQILMMMMGEACREFEKLPIFRHASILRNILYSGVWCRFATITEKRKETQEKEINGSI